MVSEVKRRKGERKRLRRRDAEERRRDGARGQASRRPTLSLLSASL